MEEEKGRGIKKGIFAGSWSGILASLCCIGPLVIILLGLGSLSFALSISKYKVQFIALGTFFLFLTIFYQLRRNKCNVFSFKDLKREKHFIISAVLSMGIIYFAALYAIVPAISPSVYERSGEIINQNVGGDVSSNLHKLTLKIDEMTCPSCVDLIEDGLLGTDGIVDVKVSYPDGMGEVIYNPDKVTKEQIVEHYVFSSFPAEIISDGLME